MVTKIFNTSGSNIPAKHYTCMREDLLDKGVKLVDDERYFTIWAPRQSGKSTYFRLLAKKLEGDGYKVTHINVESFQDISKESFLNYLCAELRNYFEVDLKEETFGDLFKVIRDLNGRYVLIIDEVEGLNPDWFNQFLHTIRNLYHSRELHCLKSVILVGVSNILGVVQDNASHFNIADTLDIPYLTKDEVWDLFWQHEEESGQRFEEQVKDKIFQITAGQPGLVNGFGYKLVERCVDKELISYADYLAIEKWYLRKAIDKNISNIINKAKQHRAFVESLLFKEMPIEFKINDERIKFLFTNGVIKEDEDGKVIFWVPLYKKVLYDVFYPYTNGEGSLFFMTIDFDDLFTDNGRINFDFLMTNFKEYVKKRSFRYFREKDEVTGEFKQIKEGCPGLCL